MSRRRYCDFYYLSFRPIYNKQPLFVGRKKIIPTHVLFPGVGGRGVAVNQFLPTARYVRS